MMAGAGILFVLFCLGWRVALFFRGGECSLSGGGNRKERDFFFCVFSRKNLYVIRLRTCVIKIVAFLPLSWCACMYVHSNLLLVTQ